MSDTNPLEDTAAPPASAPLKGDLTQGPILRTLVLFSMPALFANVLQTLGGTINTIWVGQLLGEAALAATAVANNVMFLAFALVFGFGMAATVRVGQHFGARDIDSARRVLGAGTGFCTAVAVVAAVIGWFGADALLRAMDTPASFHDDALAYIQVSFLSMPFSTLGMMVTMALRGAGDAKTPFYSMIVSTVLAIALNPVFILGMGPIPQLGIAGSALANAVASLGGALYVIVWVYWRDLPLRLRGPEWRYLAPAGKEFRYILTKGVPMGAQMLINSFSAFIMIWLVNREGLLTTAAYGAVLQIWNYIQMPSFAISMAVSAMVAQNVGAGHHGRVGRITVLGIAVNCSITLVLTVLLLAFDAPLFSLFLGSGSEAIPIAERMQLLSTWSWVLSGVMMIMIGTMRAYGVVIVPLIVMFLGQYPARLGFYYLLYPSMGPDALWWAYPFGSAVSVLLTWWAYRYGAWRGQRHMAMAAPAE